MDQGILHRFRAIRRSATTPDLSIAEAAKPFSVAMLFPVEPSLLVFVQTDAEITESRIRSRDEREIQRAPSEVRHSADQSLRDFDQVRAVFPDAAVMLAENRAPQDVSLRASEIVARVDGIPASRPDR